MSKTGLCLFLVVAALSPASAVSQWSASGAQVGIHFGFSAGGDHDGLVEERVGIQAVLPLVGPLEVAASAAKFFSFPEGVGSSVEGWGWRMFLIGRVRPLGRDSFLTVGAGLTTARLHREDAGSDPITWWETGGTAMLGAEAPFRRLRPFVELYLFGGASALAGLSVRFG